MDSKVGRTDAIDVLEELDCLNLLVVLIILPSHASIYPLINLSSVMTSKSRKGRTRSAIPCPIPLIFNASFPLPIAHLVRLITPAAGYQHSLY